jgi:hypothetical protein
MTARHTAVEKMTRGLAIPMHEDRSSRILVNVTAFVVRDRSNDTGTMSNRCKPYTGRELEDYLNQIMHETVEY